MSDNGQYWKRLVSNCLRYFQEQANSNAVFVIKNAELDVKLNSQVDSIKCWDIIFQLKYKDYISLKDKIDEIEQEITNYIDSIHKDVQNCIANVMINQKIELYIDWNAILPITKEQVIKLIQEEENILKEVATGKLSFKEKGIEEKYSKRHLEILRISEQAGFDYPIKESSLVEWWVDIKEISSYAERESYISKTFNKLLNTLKETADNHIDVDFQSITTKSNSIQKAVGDAEAFIREGKYDSAFDRVHTAFHGYLRQVISQHDITYSSADSLPTLFSKLHTYYGEAITPTDVRERIKQILRSAGGMINAINELRNNNTVSHPNGQLIQAREALLAIRLVRAIVDYIENIESSL